MARPKTSQLLDVLIQAATEIVESAGWREVTLRSVAAQAGMHGRKVSHTAAFAHVSGQLELLAHVAHRSWIRLVAELEAAANVDAPAERLVELGVTYRRFADANKNLFRVMYDAEMWSRIVDHREPGPEAQAGSRSTPFKHPTILGKVRKLRDEAFGLFVDAVLDGRERGTLRKDRPAGLMARSVASLSHGLAMEALDEKLPEEEVRPILELAVEGLLAAAVTR